MAVCERQRHAPLSLSVELSLSVDHFVGYGTKQGPCSAVKASQNRSLNRRAWRTAGSEKICPLLRVDWLIAQCWIDQRDPITVA